MRVGTPTLGNQMWQWKGLLLFYDTSNLDLQIDISVSRSYTRSKDFSGIVSTNELSPAFEPSGLHQRVSKFGIFH